MRPARIPFRLWLLGLAVSFFLAGVILRVSAASDFAITSPAPNSTLVGSTVTLQFSLPASFKLVNYQTHPRAAYGQGHIRLWVDTAPNPDDAIPVITTSYTLTHLRYGPHQVTAELVTNDNASLIPQTLTTTAFTTVSSLSPHPTLQTLLPLSLLTFISIVFAMVLVLPHRRLHPPKKTLRRSPKNKSGR